MKKKLGAMLLLLCVLLSSCGEAASAQRSLDKMMDALMKGKITRAEKYISEGTLNINTGNSTSKKFYKELFSSLSYTVQGVIVDGDKAEVSISVSCIDLEELITQVTLDSLEDSFNKTWVSGQKPHKLLLEAMQSGSASYTTSTVTAYMVRDEGKWKVNMSKSSSFADAITGGLGELIGY